MKLSDIKPTKEEIREVIEQSQPIVSEIVLPTPIPIASHSKVKSEMDFFAKKSGNFEKYVGDQNVINIYYLYLFNKYKSKCITFDLANHDRADEYESENAANSIGLDINIIRDPTQNDKLATYRHMNKIATQLAECVKKGLDTIIIPFSFRFGSDDGHANVLIYRKVENAIERFEPHGSKFNMGARMDDDMVEEKLVEFCAIVNAEFDKRKLPHIRYKNASEICPNPMGLQILESMGRVKGANEGGGYCGAWSMFFTELVLSNPGVPSAEVFDLIMSHFKDSKKSEEGPNYLAKMIQGYVYHISTKLNKYYSIMFNEPNLYTEMIGDNKAKHRKFNNYLYYLVRIELKINTDPHFNADREVALLKNKIENTKNMIKYTEKDKLLTKSQRTEFIESLSIPLDAFYTELRVYEQLGALKGTSTGREVGYKSPSTPVLKPETKTTTDKIRDMFKGATTRFASMAKRITFKTTK